MTNTPDPSVTERVARALAEEEYGPDSAKLYDGVDKFRYKYDCLARAAISSLPSLEEEEKLGMVIEALESAEVALDIEQIWPRTLAKVRRAKHALLAKNTDSPPPMGEME